MTLKTKLLHNFGANAYGQAITVLIQLVSVPFFLSHWGIKLYGEWLILSAIPSYIALSDIGFASVAANDMTMKFTQNDNEGVLRVYHSIWVLISGISLAVLGVLAALLATGTMVNTLSLHEINSFDVNVVLLLLVGSVLLGLQGNVLNAAFRSVGQYAYGTALGNTVRLGEWLGTMLAIWLGFGVVGAALIAALIKLLGVPALLFALNREVPWLKLGARYATVAEVKRLWKPALAFMAFPLGLALSLQGMVLVIGITLGATAVVMFSTYRTFTRLIVQAITLLNHSAWPEIAAAYGAKKGDLVIRLHRAFSFMAFWIGLAAVGVLSLIGAWFISTWTKHAFEHNGTLLALLLLNAFLNILWQTSLVVLMATNQLQKISIAFIVFSALCLAFSYFLLPVFGINGIGWILALFELPMIYIAVGGTLSMVKDNWRDYFWSLFSIPSRHIA